MGTELMVVEPARVLMPGGKHMEVAIPEGINVTQIIAHCVPVDLQSAVVVWNHGAIISDHENFIPRQGDKLILAIVPQGGGDNKKGILGAILTIVVAVVAWYVAPFIVGGSLGGMAALTGTQALIAQGVAAGITMLGTMAISALIKPAVGPSTTGPGGTGSPSTYTLTGQSNAARPYGACFVVYGMYKIMPALASNPNIDNMGVNSQIMSIYDFGLGYVNVYDIRIGDVPAYTYAPQLYLHTNSYCRDLQFNFNQIGYDQYTVLLNQNQYVTAVSKPDTIYADLDLNFPRGIYQVSSTWGAIPFTIQLFAEYRRAGSNDAWQSVPIDYYFGASNKWYLAPPPQTIQVSMKWDYYEYNNDPGIVTGYHQVRGPVIYDPATTPALLQSWISEYRAWLTTKYANDNSFWLTGTTVQDYVNASAPPIEWVRGTFNEANYYARYPDVANWHNQNPAINTAWKHFSEHGGLEGRDPYVHEWYENKVVVMEANSTSSYWMRVNFSFPYVSTWEMRVMRVDPSHDGTDFSISVATGGAITSQVNEAYMALLRSYKPAQPIQVTKLHTMLEMNVRATDQLNGVVQNLSAVCVSVLPVTNNGIDFWYAETRNPAWIVLDILTSEKNPKPLSRAQIDWPAWLRLVNICDTPRTWNIGGTTYTEGRFVCDIVIESFSNVKDLVESILSGCHASLSINTAGLWSVLIDEEKTTSRQLLSPANSWGFSGARSFTQYPHALRVSYINRNANWSQDEVIVYNDGYNASNATIFESLDTYGVTDYAHAWAYGRYMLAQGIQRSELFTISMDIENLVVQRGDRVDVAFDVPKIGGYPSRVVQTLGGNNISLAVNLAVKPSGYSVRLQNGTIRTGSIIDVIDGGGGDAPDTYILDNADGVQPDDLIIVGDFTRVTQPYLVQQITAGPDLSAELVLCKYAPGIYSADIGVIPPWDPGFSRDLINGTDLQTTNVVVSWELAYVNRYPKVKFNLSWITTGWNLAYHNIYLIFPSGLQEAIDTNIEALSLTNNVLFDPINAPQYFDIDLKIKVVPISGLGFEGVPGYTNLRMTGDHTAPVPPIDYGVNVQKEQIGIFWRHSDDPDIDKYLLRFTPEINVPNWDASQLLATLPFPTNSFTVGARTGTYMIRVQDTSGNQSQILYRRTTVAELPDINIITQLNDRESNPPWPGYHSNTETAGAVLELTGAFGDVSPTGYYLMSHLFDLGQPFEVRISSMIVAYGVSPADLMVNWATLAGVLKLSTVASDYWDAWLECRTSNALSVMADWVTLASIDPIASPIESQWSVWRGVRVGDFTGQVFQFRLQLKSLNPWVRTVVSDGLIILDMPDRIDSGYDVIIPAGTVDIDFNPAFRNIPALAITIDGNPYPVIAEVSQKTESGFTLGLRRVDNNALTDGKIDWMAKGYGRLRPTSI